MKKLFFVSTLFVGLALAPVQSPVAKTKEPATMPVKEVTVFKDGHAFVLHEGKMPVDNDGNVVLDQLPSPVVGTFWPYSADKKARLASVTAGRSLVKVKRTALTLRELVEANVGEEVTVTEYPVAGGGTALPVTYEAIIADVPRRTAGELALASRDASAEPMAIPGEIVLLKTRKGTKVVRLDRIADITFKNGHSLSTVEEEYRNRMTMSLDWRGKKPASQAKVGMVYLQRGIRWIPNYRVTLDGKGKAKVELQATLINELTDLVDVDAHLVVGVPTFKFKDTVDPISLRETVAQLSQEFAQTAQTAYAFGNAIMTQYDAPVMDSVPMPAGGAADLGPDVATQGRTEDLFIFTLSHITLKKGQRMVVPVTTFELDYKDIYSLDVPLAPPREMLQNYGANQNAELAALYAAPKVMHKIRLTNDSKYPLTTAPALLIKDGRLLAQGLMTFTPTGSKVDLEITTAVDVQVKKNEEETRRKLNARKWQGYDYGRVDLKGELKLSSFADKTVEVEVARNVLGEIDSADNGGKKSAVNSLEDQSLTQAGRSGYYGWYSWPYWWSHFNSIGRIKWTIKLKPGTSIALGYKWHYFYR